MSRRKQRPKQSPSSKANSGTNLDRRRLLVWGAGTGIVVAGGAAIAAYDANNRELHDLSVIGSGSPSIVQIHDPACPTCRSLKRRMGVVMKSFDSVAYRLADITTQPGKALQQKYDVPTITLLLIDGDGRHRGTIQGLKTQEELIDTINQTFNKAPS